MCVGQTAGRSPSNTGIHTKILATRYQSLPLVYTLKGSERSHFTRVAPGPIIESELIASSPVMYSRAPNFSGIPSFTNLSRGKERSWMRRQPPSLLGTRPNDEETKRKISVPSILIRRRCNCYLCRSSARFSGACSADGRVLFKWRIFEPW